MTRARRDFSHSDAGRITVGQMDQWGVRTADHGGFFSLRMLMARCSCTDYCGGMPVGQVLGAGGLDHSRCTRTSMAAPVEIPLRVSM
jgi:hypothetical protein